MNITKISALILMGAVGLGMQPALAASDNSDPHAVQVAVGYADNLHTTPGFLPTPWVATPGVGFIGTPSGPWEAGAILISNPSENALTVQKVVIDFGTPGRTDFNIWGGSPTAPLVVIPGKGSVILTQTQGTPVFNFDSSEYSSGTCAQPSTFKPVIHVTVGARNPATKDFVDTTQVLTTGGVDVITCGKVKNEGQPFVQLH